MAENVPNIGQLAGDTAQRDAVHVAVAPVVAQTVLLPGQRVNAEGLPLAPHVGIVDPYLDSVVQPRQRFWLFLFPGSVTSLRHEWTHPGFPATDRDGAAAPLTDRAYSERWLREYAARVNSYDDPEAGFQRLLDGLRSRELFFSGTGLHGFYELDDADDLKRHAETYLGIRIDWNGFSFSCSC